MGEWVYSKIIVPFVFRRKNEKSLSKNGAFRSQAGTGASRIVALTLNQLFY
jgi:hypothetical protein